MNQLKGFVMDYFEANNAKVLESKKQITIQVPKRLSEKLGNNFHFKINKYPHHI